MARYFPHNRNPDGETSGSFIPHNHPDVGAVYEDVPGYFGGIEAEASLPTWALVLGGLGAAWYLGMPLPLIGKRKK